MPLPRGICRVPPGPFAAERIDTWVLTVGLFLLLACVGGLVLWHLLAYLAGKLTKKPRIARQSPEPPAPAHPPANDPERLQEACTALEDDLARRYAELAESWLRRGEPGKAAAAFRKVIWIRPDGHAARRSPSVYS